MPSVTFFDNIQTQLLAKVTYDSASISTALLWNNQLQSLKGADIESPVTLTLPGLFVEFLNLETEQLGNGNQVYANLIVRIHILVELEDAGDGTLAEDLAVFAIRDSVQMALQNFRPAGASEFIRQKQEMDYNHNNVYHYIMDYGCTYIDTITNQPVNGITDNGPITPQINITI
jgi:hypothetical protein